MATKDVDGEGGNLFDDIALLRKSLSNDLQERKEIMKVM
jgi:hypothetical protein